MLPGKYWIIKKSSNENQRIYKMCVGGIGDCVMLWVVYYVVSFVSCVVKGLYSMF